MDLSERRLIDSVFTGGGDMGERMRAVDWSTTVLGPVAQWAQSLRACVRIMLGAGLRRGYPTRSRVSRRGTPRRGDDHESGPAAFSREGSHGDRSSAPGYV